MNDKKFKKLVIIAALITLFMAFGTSFGWYIFTKDNQAERPQVQIMAPYFLYLMNPDAKTSLQFSVGNIHPGETKQIVICVSNKRPVDVPNTSIDIAKDSKFNYDLEFIYTENLPVTYEIFELEPYELTGAELPDPDAIVVEGIVDSYWKKTEHQLNADGTPKALSVTKDVTNERLAEIFELDPEAADFNTQIDNIKMNVGNTGKYLLYQKDSQVDAQPLGLEYKNDEYEFDYYLIEIAWIENTNFIDYTKETDLLYIVVNAKQPLPKEQTANLSELQNGATTINSSGEMNGVNTSGELSSLGELTSQGRIGE